MNRLVIGIIFLMLYYALNTFTDFFTDSNLRQVYYECGLLQFLEESIIKTLHSTATIYSIFGRF